MKIYVVFEGEYSARRIDGVYSSRALAEQYAGVRAIEEYEVNAVPSHRGMSIYMIAMSKSGDVRHMDRMILDDMEEGWSPDPSQAREEIALFTVLARTHEDAIKIANERRMMVRASGEWQATFDNYFSRVPCVLVSSRADGLSLQVTWLTMRQLARQLCQHGLDGAFYGNGQIVSHDDAQRIAETLQQMLTSEQDAHLRTYYERFIIFCQKGPFTIY